VKLRIAGFTKAHTGNMEKWGLHTSYKKRRMKRQRALSEKEALATALQTIRKLYERIRMTKTKWVYLDSEEQQQLIEEMSELASELMKGGGYGKLTKSIHDVGLTIFRSATPKRGWNTRPILYWWEEEYRAYLESLCENTRCQVEDCLEELARILSRPAPVPVRPSDILENLFPLHYKDQTTTVTQDDLNRLKAYNDADIRRRLARILLQS